MTCDTTQNISKTQEVTVSITKMLILGFRSYVAPSETSINHVCRAFLTYLSTDKIVLALLCQLLDGALTLGVSI